MLIEKGQIVRPLLGIALLESKQARQALGVTKGVLIAEVIKGSSAEAAGLRGIRSSENGIIEIGDIITAIDDMPGKCRCGFELPGNSPTFEFETRNFRSGKGCRPLQDH